MKQNRWLAGFIGMIAAVACAPGISWALDYCVTFPSATNYILVGRNFVLPLKGTCRAWVGFTPQNSYNSPSTGTGCLSSDGTNFSLSITTMESVYTIFDAISLNMPSQTGIDNETVLGLGSGTISAVGAKCKPKANPIPAVQSGQPETPQIGVFSKP